MSGEDEVLMVSVGSLEALTELQRDMNRLTAERRERYAKMVELYGPLRLPRRMRVRFAVERRVDRVRYRLAEWIAPE